MARIDPVLRQQLDAASRAASKAGASGSDAVEVVVRLSRSKAGALDSAEACERRARTLLKRVERLAGEPPGEFHVFANLQSLVVRAGVPFVKALLAQPEVAAALANRQRDASGSEGQKAGA